MTIQRPSINALAAFGVPFLLAAAVAGAQDAPKMARYVPPGPDPTHVFVLDSAHILSEATIRALQDSALILQTETGADVAWVTLPTLGGRPIEEAALYIGRTWRIGTPGQPGDPLRNRGLVILYIPDKTKTAGSNFRIEVGNGLEGTITDSRSRSISAAMRDDLKAKRYDDAYLAGWPVAARLVREDFNARSVGGVTPFRASDSLPLEAPVTHSNFSFGGFIIVAFVLLMVAVAMLSRRRRIQGGASSGGAFIPFIPIDPNNYNNDDDEARRRAAAPSPDSSSSYGSGGGDSGGDSGGSSGGGDFGGGGGFSGGGSSDTI